MFQHEARVLLYLRCTQHPDRPQRAIAAYADDADYLSVLEARPRLIGKSDAIQEAVNDEPVTDPGEFIKVTSTEPRGQRCGIFRSCWAVLETVWSGRWGPGRWRGLASLLAMVDG
ncbi:hypothetical protein OR16_41651 [Cupriavidus basilensis OR16]|uniref:Uncharacterized protein n=1 Tax=Cupriavidus basilensis OR16 TaxID=1127483 RepID=H1SIK6_9BURK|nr:hypothetical protein OR16_41651 [Cupriavidus basilensis OR16]